MNQIGIKLRRRYNIIRYLGGGGFGVTYLALDEDLPGSPKCVVKQLKPKDRSPAVLSAAKVLFQGEAETLYRLEHRQIPRLFAYFEENGEFYLVEEYVEGDDLSKTELRPGKQLSEAETIELLQGILEILAFVHQQNLIHLDINPRNIIRHRQTNKLFLIDFGAVKEIQYLETNIHGQVQSSVVVGTPGYMPSEQAAQRPRLCSDVYAVGMIGIQALTGILPDQLEEDSNIEVIWRNRVQVSAQLADILDKMVRYHFSQRYPSAIEALAAIASLKHNTQVRPTQPSLPPKKSWLGYKKIALLISAVSAIAILLVGLKIWLEQRTFNFTQYKNDGITIQYPDSWSKLENSNIITNEIVEFTSPQESNSDFREKLIITGEKLSGSLSLAEYTNLSKQEIVQQNNNVKIISETNSNLAGRPAYRVVYTFSDEGNQLKRMETWTLKNYRAYSITYEAQAGKYDEYLPTAEKMINSFQLDK